MPETMAKQGSDCAAPVAATAVAADASKPAHVMELLKQFDFLSIGLGGKIHCALTNRDLPLNSVAIQQHVNSKKLKKEKEWYNADFSKYEPLIVAHKTNPKLLFCKLTKIELNRIPKEVEAHVNGKRYRNRKAEKEGLKQGQRQPLKEESDEEEEAEEGEDGPGFWAPTGGEEEEVEDMDEDDESDLEGEEEEEEEQEEGGEEANSAGAPRRAKANGKKSGARKGGGKKGGGSKGDKPRKTAKGKREDGGHGGEEEGASGRQERARGRNRKQKGGAKTNKQAEKGGAQKAARREKSSPLSHDTPGVSNTAANGAATPTASPSPSTKKTKNKNMARSPNKKGGGTPGGEGVVGGATSGGKRKHKVSEEPASNGEKKRKA